MTYRIISIIPARGGSKGIPRKNTILLCNKPLISYTINSSLKSKNIDRTFVSTEDEEIAEISRNYGAEIIKRPIELAQDDSHRRDAIKHLLETLIKNVNYNPEIIVLLQPTSPLRTSNDIDNAIELFLNNDCDSVVSVCDSSGEPYWSLKIKNNFIEPLFGWNDFLYKRRQDLPTSYILNGAIFITTPENFYKYNSLINDRTLPYIMPRERSIDIDEKIDLKIAKILLEARN